MGVGPQGPQGPPGQPGPQGVPVVVDQVKVTGILNNQNSFLNKLATSVANKQDVLNSISEQISQSPGSISDKLAENQSFQTNISNNIIKNSTVIGEKIADSIISNKLNTLTLTSALASQSNLISDISQTLSNQTLPYAKYLQGPPGSITTIKTSMNTLSMLCDTSGNCKTPQVESYLNFTSGNLVFNNKNGTPSFRVAYDGGPWIAGNNGGQLGTYNDDLNVGTVAVKWDAQGNVIVGDLSQTTGSLKIGGDMYLKHLYANGFLTAINTININTTDGSSYVEGHLHAGTPGLHKGGGGVTDGSTFTITKNGPYKGKDGNQNAVLFNNYSNPYIFGDASTSGNIFMLSNNDNIGLIPSGEKWINTITGAGATKNNAAIINNTGKIGNINGSLMLVGNAVGNDLDRVVSITDKLQIGNWQLLENTSGSLEIINTTNPNHKITLDDVLNIKSNMINGTFIRGSTVGTTIITSGNITTASLSGTNLVISGDLNARDYKSLWDFGVNNINIGGNVRGGRFESNSRLFVDRLNCDSLQGNGNVKADRINCGKDATVNETIKSYNSDINLRADIVRAEKMITKFGGGAWLCEQNSHDYAGARSCKICSGRVCHGEFGR